MVPEFKVHELRVYFLFFFFFYWLPLEADTCTLMMDCCSYTRCVFAIGNLAEKLNLFMGHQVHVTSFSPLTVAGKLN